MAIDKYKVTDVRVNQQQVNQAGERVGGNIPDHQGSFGDRRVYVEYDRAGSNRGVPHAMRTKANDPKGIVILVNTP